MSSRHDEKPPKTGRIKVILVLGGVAFVSSSMLMTPLPLLQPIIQRYMRTFLHHSQDCLAAVRNEVFLSARVADDLDGRILLGASLPDIDCLVHVDNPMSSFEVGHHILLCCFLSERRGYHVKKLRESDLSLPLRKFWLSFILDFVVLRIWLMQTNPQVMCGSHTPRQETRTF